MGLLFILSRSEDGLLASLPTLAPSNLKPEVTPEPNVENEDSQGKVANSAVSDAGDANGTGNADETEDVKFTATKRGAIDAASRGADNLSFDGANLCGDAANISPGGANINISGADDMSLEEGTDKQKYDEEEHNMSPLVKSESPREKNESPSGETESPRMKSRSPRESPQEIPIEERNNASTSSLLSRLNGLKDSAKPKGKNEIEKAEV